MSRTVDRIAFAVELCRGKRVLDIGGQKMPDCNPESTFAQEYGKIEKAAALYRVIDCQKTPHVDYVLDLNRAESMPGLKEIMDDYKPEVILCMETLEHINYHFECMNQMAHAVAALGSVVFITLPNNGNWIFNALGWNADHSVAFFKSVAERFVRRSDLGRHDVEQIACMQKYLWYWWIAYVAAFFQPFSWGFLVRPKT